ncbi:MAG: DUF308 domain-containing protein [Lacisediminihabitans sp.]
MSALQDNAAQRTAYWPVAVVRAIPAAILGLVITFAADHSAGLGLLSFGVFAVVSGILLSLMSWRRLADSGARSFLVAQGAITTAAGILALVFHGGSISVFFLIVTAFALITGFFEIYSGMHTRHRFVASNDWLVGGAITVVAGIALLLVPPGLHQSVRTAEGTTGILDASIVAVGILGAYGAILAIYLLIAGFSAKWGTQNVPVTTPEAETQTKGGAAA